MTAGSDFRRRFEAEFEPPGLLYAELLSATCNSLDLIEALERDVEANGLKTLGSKNQEVVNGSVAELRAQRAALARLLREMDLAEPASRSKAGRDLARARWGAA